MKGKIAINKFCYFIYVSENNHDNELLYSIQTRYRVTIKLYVNGHDPR